MIRRIATVVALFVSVAAVQVPARADTPPDWTCSPLTVSTSLRKVTITCTDVPGAEYQLRARFRQSDGTVRWRNSAWVPEGATVSKRRPAGETYAGVYTVRARGIDPTPPPPPSPSATVTDAQWAALQDQLTKPLDVTYWDGEDWVKVINRWTQAQTEATFTPGVVGTLVSEEPAKVACGTAGNLAAYRVVDYPGDGVTYRVGYCNHDNEGVWVLLGGWIA